MLAAGSAERYGKTKQLLNWSGRPLIRHIVEIALESGLDDLHVILGASAEVVENALRSLPVQIHFNPDWSSGQGSSVRTGILNIPDETGSATFMLSDQPLVTPILIDQLIEEHQRNQPAALAPVIDGKRGNPVLFDRKTFEELSRLTGDEGGRTLFSRFPLSLIEWIDPDCAKDIDTPDDLATLKKLLPW